MTRLWMGLIVTAWSGGSDHPSSSGGEKGEQGEEGILWCGEGWTQNGSGTQSQRRREAGISSLWGQAC